MIFVFLWFTSLSLTISRSIPVAANDIISFFLMTEWYSSVYMYHTFFIHWFGNGHLGCFHVLAIVNSAAMNIGLSGSFWIMVFSMYVPRNRIVGSYGSSTFSFLSNLYIVLHSGCTMNLLFLNQEKSSNTTLESEFYIYIWRRGWF